MTKEATFEVWQDGILVAAATGPRDRALKEARHYALVYGQDGPADIFESVKGRRKAVDEDRGADL